MNVRKASQALSARFYFASSGGEIQEGREKADETIPPSAAEPGKGFFLSFFVPRRGFWVTPLLLDLNFLVFLAMCLSGVGIFFPDNVDLLHWGADFAPLTLTGDYWRVLTCNYVHVGLIHLAMNMYALLFIGLFLEPLAGSRRMAMAYVLSGLYASLASLSVNAEWIAAGASGAIFGLYGLFFAYLLLRRGGEERRKTLLVSIAVFILYNLLFGMRDDSVDNAAHVGGLGCGFLLGLAYGMSDKVREKSKRMVVACIRDRSVGFPP